METKIIDGTTLSFQRTPTAAHAAKISALCMYVCMLNLKEHESTGTFVCKPCGRKPLQKTEAGFSVKQKYF